jgi:uncharacterized membrane protein YfcA
MALPEGENERQSAMSERSEPAAPRPEITQSPLTAAVIGLFAGAFSAFLGVGGGLIIVPALVYLLRVRQHRAHGTSLAVILPAALAGVYRYQQAGHIEWRLVIPLAAGGVLGALVGASVANAIGAGSLKRLFGLFVVVTGLLMIAVPPGFTRHTALVSDGTGLGLIALVGLIAGAVSGLLGVGGGIVMVPAIAFLLGRDQHVAQGVSLAVIIPVSISGAWIHARKGNVIPPLALWLSVGAVVGAAVVGSLVQRVSSESLRVAFGIFLIAMGVSMVARRATR